MKTDLKSGGCLIEQSVHQLLFVSQIDKIFKTKTRPGDPYGERYYRCFIDNFK